MRGKDMNTICRLCLGKNNQLLHVFESEGIPGWTAANAIIELLRIEVSEGDVYPKLICDDCMGKLVDFKLFKHQCEINKESLDLEYNRNREVGDDENVVFCSTENQRELLSKEEEEEEDLGGGPIEEDPLDLNDLERTIKSEVEESSNEMLCGEVMGSPYSASCPTECESEDRGRTLDTNDIHLPGNTSREAMKLNILEYPSRKRSRPSHLEDNESMEALKEEIRFLRESSAAARNVRGGEASRDLLEETMNSGFRSLQGELRDMKSTVSSLQNQMEEIRESLSMEVNGLKNQINGTENILKDTSSGSQTSKSSGVMPLMAQTTRMVEWVPGSGVMIKRRWKDTMEVVKNIHEWIHAFLYGVYNEDTVPKLCVKKRSTSRPNVQEIDPIVMETARHQFTAWLHAQNKYTLQEIAKLAKNLGSYVGDACLSRAGPRGSLRKLKQAQAMGVDVTMMLVEMKKKAASMAAARAAAGKGPRSYRRRGDKIVLGQVDAGEHGVSKTSPQSYDMPVSSLQNQMEEIRESLSMEVNGLKNQINGTENILKDTSSGSQTSKSSGVMPLMAQTTRMVEWVPGSGVMIKRRWKDTMEVVKNIHEWIHAFLYGVYNEDTVPKLCVKKRSTSRPNVQEIDPIVMETARHQFTAWLHAQNKYTLQEIAKLAKNLGSYVGDACLSRAGPRGSLRKLKQAQAMGVDVTMMLVEMKKKAASMAAARAAAGKGPRSYRRRGDKIVLGQVDAGQQGVSKTSTCDMQVPQPLTTLEVNL